MDHRIPRMIAIISRLVLSNSSDYINHACKLLEVWQEILLKFVMDPKFGFVTAVSHMRSFVPAIYDATIAISKSSPAPTMLQIFKGQSSVVHVHIKRHEMKDLPENDDAIAQWCRDIFLSKDKLLDKHIAEQTFGEQPLQNVGRPVKSFVVITSWACVLLLGAIKFLQSTALLSSWKGLATSAALLAVITVLMQMLIRFSQSERSTPAKPNSVNQHSRNGQEKQH